MVLHRNGKGNTNNTLCNKIGSVPNHSKTLNIVQVLHVSNILNFKVMWKINFHKFCSLYRKSTEVLASIASIGCKTCMYSYSNINFHFV